MTAEQLRTALAEPLTQDVFRRLCNVLREQPSEDVFGLLWPIALGAEGYSAEQWASRLLVEVEPWCPLTAEDALREVARSRLNLSNRLVPFYLTAQFGKRKIAKAYHRLTAAEFADEVPHELSGILYWLQTPAVELVAPFLGWRHEG